jgi:hypothetical protein
MADYTLEDARREIALLERDLKTLAATVEKNVEETEAAASDIADFKSMRAQWEGGQKVIYFLGAFTVGLSVLIYNIFSWTGVKWVSDAAGTIAHHTQ